MSKTITSAEYDAWQPIETAPKDGSWILGWRQHATRPRLIQFDTDYEEWANEDGEHVYSITHWMPLPTPPKRSMEGGVR